jgi:hypothetical protein
VSMKRWREGVDTPFFVLPAGKVKSCVCFFFGWIPSEQFVILSFFSSVCIISYMHHIRRVDTVYFCCFKYALFHVESYKISVLLVSQVTKKFYLARKYARVNSSGCHRQFIYDHLLTV